MIEKTPEFETPGEGLASTAILANACPFCRQTMTSLSNEPISCQSCGKKLFPAREHLSKNLLGWYPVELSTAKITLEEFIGNGGMGCVFRGRQNGSGEMVAIIATELRRIASCCASTASVDSGRNATMIRFQLLAIVVQF